MTNLDLLPNPRVEIVPEEQYLSLAICIGLFSMFIYI